MPIRRTSRTLNAGSVIGGFRIYSKRQGGLQHCSRLVSVTKKNDKMVTRIWYQNFHIVTIHKV